jgi:hypothetical protein
MCGSGGVVRRRWPAGRDGVRRDDKSNKVFSSIQLEIGSALGSAYIYRSSKGARVGRIQWQKD